MTDIIEEIEGAVEAVTDKKTFSIVEAIRGRSYPSFKVDVYLDEAAAFEAAELQEELDTTVDSAVDTKAIQKKIDAAVARMNKTKVTFTIGGISEGEREDVLNKAIEAFPYEYEETKSPITGVVTKTEIEDPKRDKYFTNLLWQAQIRKVESADGGVQDEFSIEEIAELRRSIPVAGLAAINEAIEKVRIATLRFMQKVNEDFLAKR